MSDIATSCKAFFLLNNTIHYLKDMLSYFFFIVNLSLPPFQFFSHFPFLSLSLFLSLSKYFSLSKYLSLNISLYISLSLNIYIYVSLSCSLSNYPSIYLPVICLIFSQSVRVKSHSLLNTYTLLFRCMDFYEIIENKRLGKGSYGTVYLCRHRKTGDEFACKVRNSYAADLSLDNR